MAQQRDEYVRQLMEKANREREAGKNSASRSASIRPTPPRSTGGQVPGAASRSQNGRQVVDGAGGAANRKTATGRMARQPMEGSADQRSSRQVGRDTDQGSARVVRDDRRIDRRAGSRAPTATSTTTSAATAQPNERAAKAASERAPRSTSASNSEPQGEAHIWFSLALIFVSLFLAMSTISYLIYWDVDESLAYFSYMLDLNVTGAQNWGGKLGAIIGNLCVGRTFGVMGLGVPVIAMIWAIRVLRIGTMSFRKATRSVLIMMLVGSVALGQFMGHDPLVFGSGYGGELGIYVAQWLESVLGFHGASLLIVIGGMGVLYFVNSGWIRGAVHWISQRAEHNRLQRAANNIAQRERDEAMRNQIAMAEARIAAERHQTAQQIREVHDASALRTDTSVDHESSDAVSSSTATATAVVAAADASITTSASEEPNAQDPSSGVPTGDQSKNGSIADGEQPLPREELGEPDDQSSALGSSSGLTKAASVDRSAMIKLEGEQWGYIYDWDVDGTAIYMYLDRGAAKDLHLLQTMAPVSSPKFGESSHVAPDSEDHEIEFIIKTYEKSEESTAAQYDPKPERTEDLPTSHDNEQVAAHGSLADQDKAHGASEIATSNDSANSARTVHFAPSPDDPNFIVEQSAGDELVDEHTINLTELYDPTRELASYKKPPVELLKDHSQRVKVSEEELVDNKNRIVHTLETFGIRIDTIEATIGPTVTLYEIIPAPGVRISKIKNLEDDIALSLSALGIRIIAPIPGRGTIGIEVPNKDKETVSMYSVIRSAKFQESKFELPIALGKTVQNETFVLDLAKMPHLLVAGATGQGKSVGLNAILTSLLYKKHPSQLKFILVDPKKVELTLYAKLEKHFLAKMPGEEDAIITDTQKVIFTLNSICIEMDARYDLLKAAKVRNILEYNDKFIHRRLNPEKGHRFLPYFVVIIDEFADLIMTAGREVETPIARIAQLARAVGIHLIIATQRPTTNIITGVIKANFPARIAFRVTSMIDSRTILDSPGANQLVGRGDMLVSTGSEVTRVQCAFIDTPEVDDITEFISSQRGYVSAYELPEYVPEGANNGTTKDVDTSKRDPLFEEVARFVVANQSGSASTIQRKYSIGFNRAGRLIDQLEAAGIVGGADGSKARQVLISDPISLEMLLD